MTEEITAFPITITTPEDRAEKRRKRWERRHEARVLTESMEVTLADIEYALRMHQGSVRKAAEFLGTRRNVLFRKIQLTPHLQRVMREIEEENLDEAEEKLRQQVQEGHFPAVRFVLATKGQKRGYTERSTVEHELGENAIRNAASLIEAMKRGAKEIDVEDYEWVEDTPAELPGPTS